MGIQSTQEITRERAINRIMDVTLMVIAKDYRGLEATTTETDHSLSVFIDEENVLRGSLTNWTDKMLEDQLDKPFYRFSMFDNYHIRG